MVTRSEAGGHLPPVLGALSARVTAKRPDLESLRGHLVRVPRTLDVDIAEGSNRVWVHDPEMDLSGEGPFAFPTVVLTADELRAVGALGLRVTHLCPKCNSHREACKPNVIQSLS